MLKKYSAKILFLIFAVSISAYSQDVNSGISLIKHEKYNAAKSYFRSMINSSPGAAYFYLGRIYLKENNPDSANSCFTEGVMRDPESALNYAGLAYMNLLQNNTAEADKNFNKALELEDDNQSVHLVMAEAYASPKIKQYDKAIQMGKKAVELSKRKSADAFLTLGIVHLSKGDGSEAIKNFEEVLKLDTDNPEALTSKAQVYILINNNTEAINLLNRALGKDSLYSPALNKLAEVYASMKDYAKATFYFEKYINASEETPDKLKRYAQLLYINKDYAKAISILENSIKTEKDPSGSLRIIAYSYLRMEDNENSKAYFEKLFALPNVQYQPSDYENYSDLLSKTGNDSLAVYYLNQAYAADSTNKDLLSKMSVLNFKLKNWDGVIYALNQKNTLTSQEYFDLAKAYVFKGDGNINKVLQGLNTALTLDTEQLANIRIALLHYQAAVSNGSSDALDKLSTSIESLLNTGQKKQWADQKSAWLNEVQTSVNSEYAKADSALAHLLEKNPTLPIGHLWRARVNANFDPESQAGLAKPFYEKFIELAIPEKEKYNKELIESYSYLGYYYYLQEDNTKSKGYWQEVLALDPDNVQANEVIKLMK